MPRFAGESGAVPRLVAGDGGNRALGRWKRLGRRDIELTTTPTSSPGRLRLWPITFNLDTGFVRPYTLLIS
jgi:hypothetical protein